MQGTIPILVSTIQQAGGDGRPSRVLAISGPHQLSVGYDLEFSEEENHRITAQLLADVLELSMSCQFRVRKITDGAYIFYFTEESHGQVA